MYLSVYSFIYPISMLISHPSLPACLVGCSCLHSRFRMCFFCCILFFLFESNVPATKEPRTAPFPRSFLLWRVPTSFCLGAARSATRWHRPSSTPPGWTSSMSFVVFSLFFLFVCVLRYKFNYPHFFLSSFLPLSLFPGGPEISILPRFGKPTGPTG